MSRRGENIYKRKDGRWEGRYVRERINGRSCYAYCYGKTYKETKEKLAAANRQTLHGKLSSEFLYNKNNMFTAVAIEWLEIQRPQLKLSSMARYTNIVKGHLIPYFGEKEILSVTQEDVSAFSRKLLHEGGRNKEGLSPKTVTGILSVLKGILEYSRHAGYNGVLRMDPVSFRQSPKPVRVLNPTEQQILTAYLKQHQSLSNLGILLSLYTGIRIGELCALKWEDISFDEHLLYINKTMQRIQNPDGEGEKTSVNISDPKSKCSIRNIPLPDILLSSLKHARCPGNTYFLTGHPHTFVEPRTLQNRFKSIAKKCHIEDAHFHVLRHTFATRCVELGFDLKSLSEILGHASVNITLNRYVHPSIELKQQNMNLLSDLFAVS